jgi:phosphotransferase system HPr-like phosphotransfer protein
MPESEERDIIIHTEYGLSCVTVVKLSEFASRYKNNEISVYHPHTRHYLDAKSMVNLLGIGAMTGHSLSFKAEGKDSKQILDGIEGILNEGTRYRDSG